MKSCVILETDFCDESCWIMDYEYAESRGNDYIIHSVNHFSLEDILECGQCFRWQRDGPSTYRGVALGLGRLVTQEENRLIFHGVAQEEFQRVWLRYFDLERDYGQVKERLRRDPIMARAVAFTPGMRVLRQEPWEALCSFIISANNNIVRIRGIVERLCGHFGEEIPGGWTFPSPQRLAGLAEDDLSPLRCGYRARYLLDAARRVAEGSLQLDTLYTAPLEEARTALRQITGVGAKVAECVLLYGLGRAECVPVDVWIGRALKTLYPDGIPEEIQPVAGLGQQYLFHYVRNCPGALDAGSGDDGGLGIEESRGT